MSMISKELEQSAFYADMEYVFALLAVAAVIVLAVLFGIASRKEERKRMTVSLTAIICIAAVVCSYTESVAFADEDSGRKLVIENEANEKNLYLEAVAVKVYSEDAENTLLRVTEEDPEKDKADEELTEDETKDDVSRNDELSDETKSAEEMVQDKLSPMIFSEENEEIFLWWKMLETGDEELIKSGDEQSDKEDKTENGDRQSDKENEAENDDRESDDAVKKMDFYEGRLSQNLSSETMSAYRIISCDYSDSINELVFDVKEGERVRFTLELFNTDNGETEDSVTFIIDRVKEQDVYPDPTEILEPSISPVPSETPNPSPDPDLTQIPTPTESADPAEKPEPTESPAPSETPAPTESVSPTESPAPAESPVPTETLVPTKVPAIIKDPWPVIIIINDPDEEESGVNKDEETNNQPDESDLTEDTSADDSKITPVPEEQSVPDRTPAEEQKDGPVIIEKDGNGSIYLIDGDTQKEISNIFLSDMSELIIVEKNADRLVSAEVTVTVGDETTKLDSTDYVVTETNENGKWQYEYAISAENFEKEGVYRVNITSVDESGNTSNNRTSGTKVDFVVDKTAPVMVVSGIADGASYEENSCLVKILLHDNTLLKSFAVYKDGEIFKSYLLKDNVWENEDDPKDQLTFSGNMLELQLPGDTIAHTYKFSAADESGNTVWSEEYTVSISGDSMGKVLIFTAAAAAVSALVLLILKIYLNRKRNKHKKEVP